MNIKIQDFARRFLNLLDARIAEFEYALTVHTDQVIVLFVSVGAFKLGLVFAELVFGNKAAVEQQLNGIVKRGAAYPVLFVFHVYVQRLNVEVPAMRVNFIKNGETLRRLPVSLFFKVFRKDLLNGFAYIGIGCGHRAKNACKINIFRRLKGSFF